MKTRNHIIVALVVMLVFVGFFLWREYSIAGVFGFPLDDSWIHAQFARNLALGNGFSYNPGVPASGSTAPLWTLVSATGYLTTGDPVLSAKVLGVLFFGFTVFFVYAIVRTMTSDPRQALFAAIVTASLPRLTWASLSGMEVTLTVMLSLAGILTHILYARVGDRRQYLSTVLFGLATLARPECAVFFVAAMIDRVLASVLIRWRELAARDWLVPVIVHAALFLVIIAPFLIFSKRFGVGFLPNTAYAKALVWDRGLLAAFAKGSVREVVKSFTVYPFDYFLSFLVESLTNNLALFVFSSFGFLRLVLSNPYAEGSRCRSFIVPLSAVLFPLAIGIVVPFGTASFQEGRYAAPVAPLMLIIGTVGLYEAARYGARIFSEAKSMGRPAKLVLEKSLVWLFMLLVLFVQGRHIWLRSDLHGREVDNIETMQVTLGKWIDRHLPRDAVVAVNDVGAIAYFSNRELLDTVGLISPDILAYRRQGQSADAAMFSLLKAKRPDYAVLFPDWYPESVRKRLIFEPIHTVVLDENVICGGDEMVVYKLNWDVLESPEGTSKRELEEAARGDPPESPKTDDRLDR